MLKSLVIASKVPQHAFLKGSELSREGWNQSGFTVKFWLLAAALCPLWVERAFLKGGTGQGSHPPALLVHPLPQLVNSLVVVWFLRLTLQPLEL